VALVALGATVPALSADLPARTYTKAPAYAAPLYNWTGFYIGVTSAARSAATTIRRSDHGNNNDARFLACAGGGDYHSLQLGRRIEGQYSWLGSNNNGIVFPRGFIYTTPACARLRDRPRRLHLGSGPALREGRLCLLRQQRVAGERRRSVAFAFNHGHRDGYTVGAGLEYLFTRTGRQGEYQYYNFGNSTFVTRPHLPVRSFRTDDHVVKAV